jgi:hypothetical protein
MIVVVSPVHRVPGAACQRLGRGGVRAFWPRPRIRRPVDVARLLLAAAALAALVLLAVLGPIS